MDFKKVLEDEIENFVDSMETRTLREIRNELIFLKKVVGSSLVNIKVNTINLPKNAYVEFGPDNILQTDISILKDFRVIKTIFHGDTYRVKCIYGLDRFKNPTQIIL